MSENSTSFKRKIAMARIKLRKIDKERKEKEIYRNRLKTNALKKKTELEERRENVKQALYAEKEKRQLINANKWDRRKTKAKRAVQKTQKTAGFFKKLFSVKLK